LERRRISDVAQIIVGATTLNSAGHQVAPAELLRSRDIMVSFSRWD
jgi:hypothetical protein